MKVALFDRDDVSSLEMVTDDRGDVALFDSDAPRVLPDVLLGLLLEPWPGLALLLEPLAIFNDMLGVGEPDLMSAPPDGWDKCPLKSALVFPLSLDIRPVASISCF